MINGREERLGAVSKGRFACSCSSDPGVLDLVQDCSMFMQVQSDCISAGSVPQEGVWLSGKSFSGIVVRRWYYIACGNLCTMLPSFSMLLDEEFVTYIIRLLRRSPGIEKSL